MRHVVLVALTACSFPGEKIHDAANSDAVDAQSCFGGGAFTICLSALPTTPLAIETPTTIDTDGSLCTFVVSQNGGRDLCVMAGTSVSVSDVLTATGSRPLVLLATGDAMISGAVDVSSRSDRMPSTGAGSNDSSCGPTGDGVTNLNGGGGGAGGSFGSEGGRGGTGGGNMGVAGGTAAPLTGIPTTLRGGCSGGAGGSPSNVPGAGGGAVYIVAAHTLQLSGVIDASGEGGPGGRISKGGGPGAGSGGMVVVWATNLVGAATIFANGGGGGGGADNGASGQAGEYPMGPSISAKGGVGGSAGAGVGGDGGFLTNAAGAGSNDTTGAGGGGGGGGVGFVIVASGQALGGSVSPPSI